jgi:hypothetical protein
LVVRVTRGGFLKLCSLALVAPLTDASWIEALDRAPAIAPGRDYGIGAFDLRTAEPDDFRAVMFSEFVVTGLSGAVPVRVRLSEFTDGPPDARILQYSLTFTGGGQVLPERTYTFHHAQLGDFDLFVVPASGRDSAAVVYHACISRMRET